MLSFKIKTLLCEIEGNSFVYGVFIDIFPLEECSDTLETFQTKYMNLRNAQRMYQLSQMRFNISDIINYYRQGDKKDFYKDLLSIFFHRIIKEYYRKYLLKYENLFKGQIGNKIVCSYGECFKKEYQEKSWYKDYALLPFGNISACFPSI